MDALERFVTHIVSDLDHLIWEPYHVDCWESICHRLDIGRAEPLKINIFQLVSLQQKMQGPKFPLFHLTASCTTICGACFTEQKIGGILRYRKELDYNEKKEERDGGHEKKPHLLYNSW